jgi:hypothetical protein
MAASSGPDIVDRGLVLALDAADRNSFDSNENLLSTSIRTTDRNGATSGSGWTLTANNATSPDETITATLLTQTSSLSNSAISWIGGGNSAGQVMSIFCKPVSGNAVLQGQTGNGDGWTANLSTNVFTDSSGGRHANGRVDVYPDGWKRVIIPMVSIPPFSGGGSFPGGDFYLTLQGAGSVLLWGWQRENGSTANPYYPTTGTAKTRGTTWTDLTGRGNTGTLVLGPTYSSANGGSIVFDGIDDYVSTLTSNSYLDMTIAVYINSAPSNLAGILASGTATDKSLRYTSSLQLQNPGDANDWAYPGTTFYVNGVVSNQLSLGWNIISGYRTNQSTFALNFTAYFGTSGYPERYLNGRIGCAYLYNRALSAAEIQQNFNAVRSRFGI